MTADPPVGIGRRLLAEFVGTAFLVAAVVGSGIAAALLSPDDMGLQLLENALITGAALVALILALQPVSAAFNPVVTVVERALGLIGTRDAALMVGAQIAGGLVGVVAANLMFDLEAVSISGHDRSGAGLWLGEVVATLGLVMVIFGSVRAGRTEAIAFAVGGYITAAYWFTSSTSFANPAVTVARMFSDTFAGIAPASVPMFLGMQVVGGALAVLLVRALYPRVAPRTQPETERVTPQGPAVSEWVAPRTPPAYEWLVPRTPPVSQAVAPQPPLETETTQAPARPQHGHAGSPANREDIP